MRKTILFFIPNLMHGGAEKVLVNLVNNLDPAKYDITVQTIFDVGVNKQYLKKHINYQYVFKKIFRGSTTMFKMFSPEFLYKKIIIGNYDIIISYLEGPTARIISGCNNEKTKKVAWIHTDLHTDKVAAGAFRNFSEAQSCYQKFEKIICVSDTVRTKFTDLMQVSTSIEVLYNINETEQIIQKATEKIEDLIFDPTTINICSVGKIVKVKDYYTLARVHKRLIQDGIKHHIYILGIGEEKGNIDKYLSRNHLTNTFTFLGYKKNPYTYVAHCNLYVCSSLREGFSTAVTEALIVGTPVLTTLCSGMKEILGTNNEYGFIVDNNEDALYLGLKQMLTEKELLQHYKQKALERGPYFSKEKMIAATEKMLSSL